MKAIERSCVFISLVVLCFLGYATSQTTDAPATVGTNATNSSLPSAAPSTSPQAEPTTSMPTGPVWGGCVNPEFPDDPAIITIGDPTYVCLTIGPGGNWARGVQYLRYMFKPQADQYSRFVIPNSYRDLVVGKGFLSEDGTVPPLTVHSASQTSLSFLRTYYNGTAGEGKVYPFLTAVVDVRDGIVQGIAWDDACVFCNKKRCEEITWNFAGVSGRELGLGEPTSGCYIEEAECNKNPAACDLVLYTVWTGTDDEGNPFTSSGSRFSAFPPQEIQNQITNNLPELDLPDIIPGTRT